MRRGLLLTWAIVLVAIVLAIGGAFPAAAAVQGYEATLTMDAGTSETVATVTLARSEIKEVYLYCPILDEGDTATATLRMAPVTTIDLNPSSTATLTVTPPGWSDKGIGATSDNAVIRCNSSVLEIYSDNDVVFTVLTSSNQAADRTFRVLFLVRH